MRWGKLRDPGFGVQDADWVTGMPEGAQDLDDGSTVWVPAVRVRARPLGRWEGEDWVLVLIAIEHGSGLRREDIRPALDTGHMLVDEWFVPATGAWTSQDL